jgi:glycosyltransferase involved in cell wall biosynthesis
VLVGTGPEESSLRLEAAALGVESRVRFAGLVAYDRLPEAYAAADVVVVPSSNEPWGLPVNEAMVCGRPVVASDRVGSAADLVQDGVTGVIYPCGDTTRLAAALDGILGDPTRAVTMGRAARTRMDDWSPAANADAVAAAARRAVALRASTGRAR